jgi:hypothetical protein
VVGSAAVQEGRAQRWNKEGRGPRLLRALLTLSPLYAASNLCSGHLLGHVLARPQPTEHASTATRQLPSQPHALPSSATPLPPLQPELSTSVFTPPAPSEHTRTHPRFFVPPHLSIIAILLRQTRSIEPNYSSKPSTSLSPCRAPDRLHLRWDASFPRRLRLTTT